MLSMVLNKETGLMIFLDGITGEKALSFGGIIAILCCVLAVTAAFYALRSIGLYTLAKNNGIDHAFVAWIPFAWIYVACKLISETRMFGWSFKNIAVWALVIFSVSGVLDIVYNVLTYFPAVGYLLQGGTITIVEENAGMKLYLGSDFVNPYGNAYSAVKTICTVINVTTSILSLFTLVVTVFAYIGLFKKFWPQHYIIASVFSVLGLFPIFVFAVRNKPAMNYGDYIRSRFYYGENYGQNPPPGTERPPEHPFEEFAERGEKDPGDPFAEFADDKDKKDDK